jgi:Holliday junction resolvase RusA-like endonuclease
MSPSEPEPRAVEISIPGDPVPWAPKQVAKKTGNRFLPSRQAKHADTILVAVERAIDAGAEPFGKEPLCLQLEFVLTRPKAHFGTGKNADVLKDSAPPVPMGKPDLSNLVKLVEDGLVLGGLIPDDDQVVSIVADKFYGRRARSNVLIGPAE